MKMTELFFAELERETPLTRRVLERVPEGRNDWKPHPKSMPLGYLATLVATIPSWIAMMVTQNELDFDPPGGKRYSPPQPNTNRELLEAFDQSVAKARNALQSTSDEHLMTNWRFLTGGRVVSEQPRYVVMRDGVLNHLAHHRGQLTVYLRLNDVPVPSIYGPSADERPFD